MIVSCRRSALSDSVEAAGAASEVDVPLLEEIGMLFEATLQPASDFGQGPSLGDVLPILASQLDESHQAGPPCALALPSTPAN